MLGAIDVEELERCLTILLRGDKPAPRDTGVVHGPAKGRKISEVQIVGQEEPIEIWQTEGGAIPPARTPGWYQRGRGHGA